MGQDEIDAARMQLERDRLAFESQKLEFEREKLDLAGKRSLGQIFSNPMLLAVIGGLISIFTSIILNDRQIDASLETEKLKAGIAKDTARDALEADLIKRFVEGPSILAVRDNLTFLIEVGLLPSYAEKIKQYLKENEGSAPQVLLNGGFEGLDDIGDLTPASLRNHFFSARRKTAVQLIVSTYETGTPEVREAIVKGLIGALIPNGDDPDRRYRVNLYIANAFSNLPKIEDVELGKSVVAALDKLQGSREGSEPTFRQNVRSALSKQR
ncbi:hypothetical protein P9A16_34390 [Shinella sp. 838]|uniref:hypothetical protein n=1 Tax=Shinella sp. 838 TaxID=3038164 RepID=UPI00241569B9|nr:hypothetical protein [Shinella sp. 838]MDG4676175.1 hypothetical protein [Shinella sp. 838]